jgi:DNA mismatch endonuclease (patch repair protein)
MQSNRSRDTKPEIALRRQLHALGMRYRVCAQPLVDFRRTADVVFRRARVAVELRGCFWHGCPDHYRRPAAHNSYWSAKVARNMERDAETARRLSEAGWSLIVVWEHEDLGVAAASIAEIVAARRVEITGRARRRPSHNLHSGTPLGQ